MARVGDGIWRSSDVGRGELESQEDAFDGTAQDERDKIAYPITAIAKSNHSKFLVTGDIMAYSVLR